MCQHALCEKKLLQHAMLQNPQAEFCNMAPGVLQHGSGVLQHGSVGSVEGPRGRVANEIQSGGKNDDLKGER